MDETTIKVALAHAILRTSYDINLPKAFHHDVAYDCIFVMANPLGTPFVVMFRECGTHSCNDASSVRNTVRVFGTCRIFRYRFDAETQTVERVELTEDEAIEYLSEISS